MPSTPYTLRRKRFSRVVRFVVHGDGRLVVTAPVMMGVRVIEKMIAEKGEWIAGKREMMKGKVPEVSAEERREMYEKHKGDALRLVQDRLAVFNQVYGLRWKNVRIKNSRTRWGSCSGKGNLNFHYKIALLPIHLADYIIVHELCHLAQMNHSPRFWALVAKTIPDHIAHRKEIRKYGLTI